MALYNKLDKKLLKQKLAEEPFKRVTLSFYQYAKIEDVEAFRNDLYRTWEQYSVFGRIYVATEGINAQLSVPEPHFEAWKTALYSIDFLDNVRLNIAVEDDGKSFYKLKIKIRPKILADGLNDDTFEVTDKGKHLNAEEFNELTADKETVIVDMRNHYESEVGHFENAICPDVDTFRDSLPIVEEILEGKEDNNIVMYCTGGIRCEKASAWFKHKGFKKVHQLEGGIINYAREAEKKGLENKFKGKNFVFDDRLGERISNEIISKCHQCENPCDTHTNCANDACHLLFIQCKECATQYDACCSDECQETVHLPLEEQRERRKGIEKGAQIYRKGRNKRLRPKLYEERQKYDT
ncbi:MAG: rhodanese-related sulfurtransferase [Chitinophagales bacterium]